MRRPRFITIHDSTSKTAQAAMSDYAAQRARRRRAYAARHGTHGEQVRELEQLARSLHADMEQIMATACYDGPGRSLTVPEQEAFNELHGELVEAQRKLRRLRGEP